MAKTTYEILQESYREALDRIESLQSQVASLSKDRDRLNWLDAKGEEFTAYGKVRRMEWAIEGTTDLSLRSAIDQAMQVSEQETKE